ncbi:unnamed protein product [Clonostachys rhizophaga]|uniref:Uncharacterized protein n=1 Tax=Clonostachys rhizophaga TaxID=160324 RepID=A0A9N9YUJ8_9HYPO|nr:unnamed protein product [Clonostachys rhizophaga]
MITGSQSWNSSFATTPTGSGFSVSPTGSTGAASQSITNSVPGITSMSSTTNTVTGGSTDLSDSGSPEPTRTPTTATAGNNGGMTTTWASSNSTAPTPSPFPAANYTQVAFLASLAEDTCYHLPEEPHGELSRRALMRNSKLREDNVTVPVPYIQSVEFESEGVRPLSMTVRDKSQGTFHIDISNRSRLAIASSDGYAMQIDGSGIRFATKDCRYDVNITIPNLFSQIANLSSVGCSVGTGAQPFPSPIPVPLINTNTKRAEDIKFNQTLLLRDQCGSPVTKAIRAYPQLRVGETTCQDIAVDENSGTWEFDCTFPGAISGILKCQNAVKNDIIDFLNRDSFGGACPDISTMIATLGVTGNDMLSRDALGVALYNQRGASNADNSSSVIENVASGYTLLWESLQGFFTPQNASVNSPWEEYIGTYNKHRSFENDICEDLHTGEIPLSLNLLVGATYIDAVTTLNWAPRAARSYNVTVQDPAAIACCPNGSEADDQGKDTCAYPREAVIEDTNCSCGKTAGGQSLAFEAMECDNFEGRCERDEDCQGGGSVCVVGTCCGGGVCVDPYACSQNGTALVKFADGWS